MIPKHFELHKPILEYLSDGEQHSDIVNIT